MRGEAGRRLPLCAGLALVAVVLLAACGSPPQSSSHRSEAPAPVTPTASPSPTVPPTTPVPPTGTAVPATLSAGDLATLLSLFVTDRNSGPSGQVLTPTAVMPDPQTPPRAAVGPDGVEWAMVVYQPAPDAPEPLTMTELQNGAGTAFFSKDAGQQWVLRGLAGRTLCTGAATAQVPAAVLTAWGESC